MANGSSDRGKNQCCCCNCHNCRSQKPSGSDGQPWLLFLTFAILMALLSSSGLLQEIFSDQEYSNLPRVEIR